MKKILFILLLLAVYCINVHAQNVGIGTATPDASAMLDIKASGKGLLIPRTSTVSRITIASPAKGLLVYDTTTSSFWYHNGTIWVEFGAAANAWGLNGNAGTNSATSFVGTTDNQALHFRINNTNAGILDSLSQNTAIGYRSLDSTTGVAQQFNTAIGYKSLISNIAGTNNTATGGNTLRFNKTGNNNTATGYATMYNNTTGINNTAVGAAALIGNTTGKGNVAVGKEAAANNLSGYSNVAIGVNALYNNTAGINNTAIGTGSLNFNTTYNIFFSF